jgi:hypothetical protein
VVAASEVKAGYDPLKPTASDWQKVLERVAEQLGKRLPRGGPRLSKSQMREVVDEPSALPANQGGENAKAATKLNNR